jgi:chaperonin GroEL (HSP60 family)
MCELALRGAEPMHAKQIVFSETSRQAILRGVNQLADTVKVVRSALANAASIAGLLLTSEALVAQAPADAS